MKLAVLTLSSLLLLSGCGAVGLATGAGAMVGMAATKEGGIKSGISDASIKAQINDLWFRHNVDMFRKLSMTVDQGRVLLTGVVQNPEDRVDAVRLAWQPKGVKQVINEIKVGDTSGVTGFAQDEWITAQLRTKLIANKYVQSVNYNIEVVQGSVYLMGVAQNQEELDRVIRLASGIKGVKEVVSYVKMLGEPISSSSGSGGTTVQGGAYATQPANPVPLTAPAADPYYADPSTPYQSAPMEPVMPAPVPSGIESEVLPP